MNIFYQEFKKNASLGSRDPVFKHIIYNWLSKLEYPVILNIGCERNTRLDTRGSDGWANFHWAEFIKNKGTGELVIIDNDPQAIEVSKTMLDDFKNEINISFICGDGFEEINKLDYNFYYFDGPDDNPFTLRCFEKVDLNKASILCDDSNIGGKSDLLRAKYPNYFLFPCNYLHELVFYPSEELKQKVLC